MRGHIELERSIDSIRVGGRHRVDLGDVDALAASIEQHGLLQPITVTPEGVLVCGARRLAALRRLGVRTVNVWVRAGVTDRLTRVLAEQDDDALHKALTPTESASLYRELKGLLAEDAARRQEASRFTTKGQLAELTGAATMAAPSVPKGDARAQAAELVTGRRSYTTLERIGDLERVAADATIDPAVRERAEAELASIDDGAPVAPAHQRVRAQLKAPTDSDSRTSHATKLPVRAFVFMWDDLRGWWEKFDYDEIAASLTGDQWRQFEETVAGTVAFAEALSAERDARAAAPNVIAG
ncbi:ParB/RepB/Spo0J family partition protein [Microbacterium sp. 2FI]|uniref:ParB N-terminal domain-containing protein n=1 Tax=Microbacterium sp. 2FI TaxID=2502193 RepID=UPI0010F84E95|nr:ParB/RepB/Spo0J family partition protein [Microbacterium sp. 2FI]